MDVLEVAAYNNRRKEKKMAKKKTLNPRCNKVGGEAVLEGVMMKAGNLTATACRKEDGSVVVVEKEFHSVRKKKKFLNIPILRGVVNFVEMMILSFGCLNASAQVMGGEIEEESRFEKWLKKKFGANLFDIVMIIGGILGVVLAVFLFMFLPALVARGVNWLFLNPFGVAGGIGGYFALVEGVVKVVVFVSYIALIGLLPDIKRTFAYHGAEHKSIACYENGGELVPAEAKKHTRFHPRCGTSFMFVMILLGIILGFFIPTSLPAWLRSSIRLLCLPVIMGLGFEFIMFAGKHDNWFTRLLSAPGIWMQRLTTKEPTEKQLEVALIALQYALVEEFPDFDRAGYRFVPKEDTEDSDTKDFDTEETEITEIVENPDAPQTTETDDTAKTTETLENPYTDEVSDTTETEDTQAPFEEKDAVAEEENTNK